MRRLMTAVAVLAVAVLALLTVAAGRRSHGIRLALHPARQPLGAVAARVDTPRTGDQPRAGNRQAEFERSLWALVAQAIRAGENIGPKEPVQCGFRLSPDVDDRLAAANDMVAPQVGGFLASWPLRAWPALHLTRSPRRLLAHVATDDCAPYSTLVVLAICDAIEEMCDAALLQELVESPPASSGFIKWQAFDLIGRVANADNLAFLAREIDSNDPSRVAFALRGISGTRAGALKIREYLLATPQLPDDVSRALTVSLLASKLSDDPAIVSDLLGRRSPQTISATLDALATTKRAPAREVLDRAKAIACDSALDGPSLGHVASSAVEVLAVRFVDYHANEAGELLWDIADSDTCPLTARARALVALAPGGGERVRDRALALIPAFDDADELAELIPAYLAAGGEPGALVDVLARWTESHQAEGCRLASLVERSPALSFLTLEQLGLQSCVER